MKPQAFLGEEKVKKNWREERAGGVKRENYSVKGLKLWEMEESKFIWGIILPMLLDLRFLLWLYFGSVCENSFLSVSLDAYRASCLHWTSQVPQAAWEMFPSLFLFVGLFFNVCFLMLQDNSFTKLD